MAVLVAVSMVVLLGVMALVLDAGMLMVERREAQAAADAAALAASQALGKDGGTLATARTAAQAFATANGFPPGAGLTLTVNSPPSSGPFAGDSTAVEVRLSHRSPRFFSAIWDDDDLTMTARAVVRRAGGGDGDARLLLLDTSRSGALSLVGSGRIVSDAGIHVNSSSPTAVIANNSGSIQPKTAGKANTPVTKIVGGYTDQPWSKIQGKIITGAAPVSDPLASLPEPPQTGQLHTKLPFSQNYGSQTMGPGFYNVPGGVKLEGGGLKVTMQPGIYYVKGDFTVANGVTLTGTNVMIFAEGRIWFGGGSPINLTPPASGPYQGIIMYQRRTATQNIQIDNGVSTNISGTIYAAGARMSFAGGSHNNFGDLLIAKSMDISNNAQIGFGGGSSGSTATAVHNLVE